MFGKLFLLTLLFCAAVKRFSANDQVTTTSPDYPDGTPVELKIVAPKKQMKKKSWCSYGNDEDKQLDNVALTWDIVNFYYKVMNYPTNKPDMTNEDVDRIIDDAWRLWAEASETLTFSKSELDNATMKISFVKGKHDDKSPFDGPGNTLGHGFTPKSGIIHFDDDETWIEEKRAGTQLLYVATHEFGHALGLGHSEEGNAIMYPNYPGYYSDLQLDEDDILAIQAAYPKKP